MNLKVFENTESLYTYAADLVFSEITKKPKIVLGLAAGKTPTPLYRNLAHLSSKQKVSFSQLTTFNLDEYVGVKKDHPMSFYFYTKKSLFELTDIDFKKTHSLDGAVLNLEEECERYENLIESAGGIDLQVLGLGTNGHVGFNEPGSKPDSRTRIINLSQETRSKLNPKDFPNHQIPEQGITIGIANLLESKKIILIATGESKAKAVAQCFEGFVTPNWPGSLLQNHKDLTVLVDASAAKFLEK